MLWDRSKLSQNVSSSHFRCRQIAKDYEDDNGDFMQFLAEIWRHLAKAS